MLTRDISALCSYTQLASDILPSYVAVESVEPSSGILATDLDPSLYNKIRLFENNTIFGFERHWQIIVMDPMALPKILRADSETDVQSYPHHKSLHSRNDDFPVLEIRVAGKETAP